MPTLFKPLVREPAKHLYKLANDPAYRRLCRLSSRYGGVPRFTPATVRLDGRDFRVSDIASFLAAFDAALAEDTQESRSGLREATDRLLRAGARTRIELERLEARIPLPPRDNIGRNESGWRYR